MADIIEQLTASYMAKCVHFNGIQHGTCDAGVAYDSVRDASQAGPYCWPCLSLVAGKVATTTCPQRRYPTREEANARATEVESHLQEHERKLAEGKVCPNCDRPITGRRVVGHCEYLEPCGHRTGQVR